MQLVESHHLYPFDNSALLQSCAGEPWSLQRKFMTLFALKILVNWRIWVDSFPDARNNRDSSGNAGNFTDNGMNEQKPAC